MTRKKSSEGISDQEWDEDTNISYNSAKVKDCIIALMALIVIIVGAGIAYAALTLSVQNNVSINPGIGLATFSTLQANCPALGDPAYGTVTPYTNNVLWSITAGGSQTEYFCIENQGSGNDANPSITLTSIPNTITCITSPCLTLTTNPSPIPAIAAQTVSSPIAVTLSATTSATGSGNVVITVT